MPAAPQPWCRVLIVDHDLYLYGSQQYVLRQADWLERQGIELMLAGPAEGALAKAWQERGRRHVALEIPRLRTLNTSTGRPSVLRLLREIYRVLRGTWRTVRVARRVRADVLDANSHGWAFNEVVLAGRLLRRPTLVHLHMRVEPSPVRLARAIAVHGATATIGVSNAVVESLPAWARRGCTSSTPASTPNALPPVQRTRPRALSSPTTPMPRLSCSSLGSPRVRASITPCVPSPTFHPTCPTPISSSPAPPSTRRTSGACTNLARSLLGDRVHFLGPRTDVDQLLRTASALVLPSESEGLPLSLLEAQASGIPTVAYPAGGCAELIRHEVTGLLAEQGNVQDLSRQLGRLLSDPGLAKELADNALDHVRANHTMQSQSDAHVAVLRRLSRRAQGRNL